jgi:two-component system chemotaxis response regulator CheB
MSNQPALETGKIQPESTDDPMNMNHDVYRASGQFERPAYDAVVIAASRGGIEAVSRVLCALPAELPAAIFIVLHRSMELPNYQAQVLGKGVALPVRIAHDGERIHPSTVYLAPPHLHLVIRSDRHLALRDGRKVRYLHSAADPLFQTAAEVFGPRVVAVVLTGGDRDGTDGALSVKRHKGTVFAQDAATSEDFSMPRSAIRAGCVDRILPIEDIGPALVQWVMASQRGNGKHIGHNIA